MDVKKAVQERFGAVADRYARSRGHLAGPDLDALVTAARLVGRETVLDVGCGTGHTTRAVARPAARVVGLDLTEAMLSEARRLAAEDGLANVEFRRGDAEALPFDDESFDAVTCRLCAHHFGDPRQAVREAARVLRPGGRFVLVDSIAPEEPALDTFLNCIELLRDGSHVRDHRLSEWRAWLVSAGLRIEEESHHPMLLDFGSWFERMQTPEPLARAVRALFDDASDAVRATFAYRAEAGTWTIPIALVAGVAGP